MRRALRGKAPGLRLERSLWDAGAAVVAGVDEVGRGSWAGPLTVAALVADPDQRIYKVRDSKMLTSLEREVLCDRIIAWARAVSVGHASVDECTRLGMADAQRLAAQRAVAGLGMPVDHVLVDGSWDFVTTADKSGTPVAAVVGDDPSRTDVFSHAVSPVAAVVGDEPSPADVFSHAVSPVAAVVGDEPSRTDVFSHAVSPVAAVVGDEPSPADVFSHAVSPVAAVVGDEPSRTDVFSHAVSPVAAVVGDEPSRTDVFSHAVSPVAAPVRGGSCGPTVTTVVRGDSLSLSIAAASVVAKVTRDRMMTQMADCYPGYWFASNKGYPCPRHVAALAAWGPCAIHRRRWAFMSSLRWTGVPRIEPTPVTDQLELFAEGESL